MLKQRSGAYSLCALSLVGCGRFDKGDGQPRAESSYWRFGAQVVFRDDSPGGLPTKLTGGSKFTHRASIIRRDDRYLLAIPACTNELPLKRSDVSPGVFAASREQCEPTDAAKAFAVEPFVRLFGARVGKDLCARLERILLHKVAEEGQSVRAMRRPDDASLDSEDREMSPIEAIIEPRPRPVDTFTVRRLLPTPRVRNVGPFVFFDHMGPNDFGPGEGINVRPHPHIGLATVTYLFEGEVFHRDSLGFAQVIRPAEVNWMTAGRGIVHSERPVPGAGPMRLHGLQLWVALPLEEEECEPKFDHYDSSALPVVEREGLKVRVVVGQFGGARSAVTTLSEILYLDIELKPGGIFGVPFAEERALYSIEGSFVIDGRTIEPGHLVIVKGGAEVSVESETGARLVLIGGDALDAPRFIDWNFVSSSEARIAAAKEQWRRREFPLVPGDEVEFIPLPGELSP